MFLEFIVIKNKLYFILCYYRSNYNTIKNYILNYKLYIKILIKLYLQIIIFHLKNYILNLLSFFIWFPLNVSLMVVTLEMIELIY